MAVTISVSDSSSDIWMAKNSVFAEFSKWVIPRNESDIEVVSLIEISEACGGISLDHVSRDQPELAIRLRDAFLAVAEEIASGTGTLPGAVANDAAIQSHFSELCVLLRRFP